MKKRNNFNREKFIILLFLLLLAVPVCKMGWSGGTVSKTEKRVLAKFPVSIDHETGKLSVSRAGIENWANDNIGFRDLFLKVHANLKFRVLGITTSDKVEKGRDGWYFYTQDHNIEIASQTYPNFDEDMLAEILEQQTRIQNKLQEQGIEYVLVLPPSKVSIYPENLAGGNYKISKTPVDILADYLEKNSDIKVVLVKDALLNAKMETQSQLYFKTDTHWTEYGAYIAYKKVVEDLRKWGMFSNNAAEVTFETGMQQGEFSAMLGDPSILGPEETLKASINDAKAYELVDGELYHGFQSLIAKENIQDWRRLYKNDSVSWPRVLMYGDSMCGLWNMPDLFAENCSIFSYVWSGDLQQEMIDYINPDIVIYEITERYLNILTTKGKDFTKQNSSNLDAEIVAQEIPTELTAGQTCSFSVTVKNIGTCTWSELDQIRLGIFLDGEDSGYMGRAYIPAGVKIAPGESYTFTFKDFVPTISDVKLEFTMLQEGNTYFGERVTADTKISQKPLHD